MAGSVLSWFGTSYFLHLLLGCCVAFLVFAVGSTSAHQIRKSSWPSKIGVHVQGIAVSANMNKWGVGNSVLIKDCSIDRHTHTFVSNGIIKFGGDRLFDEISNFLLCPQSRIVMTHAIEVLFG